MKVGILGASGYTGEELLRLLLERQDIDVVYITSRRYEGKTLTEINPRFINTRFESLKFEGFSEEKILKCDLIFSCLPHGESKKILENFLGKVFIIDLSEDYRKDERALYGLTNIYEFYTKHFLKRTFKKDLIKKYKIIANPGCYPTSIIIPLYPLVKGNFIDKNSLIICDSKSGASGAGKKLKENLLFCELNENFYCYKPINHRHEKEIKHILNIKNLKFTPHILPIERGILSTIYFKSSYSLEDIKSLLKEFYKNDKNVKILNEYPQLKFVNFTNEIHIYLDYDKENDLFILLSAIDNLRKGAAGQAVENLDILIKYFLI